RALEPFPWGDAKLLGVHVQMSHETLTLAHLFTPGPFPVDLRPLQPAEIDVGDPDPVRCLKNALWLARKGGMPFAVLLTTSMQFGRGSGVHVEIATPAGE